MQPIQLMKDRVRFSSQSRVVQVKLFERKIQQKELVNSLGFFYSDHSNASHRIL